MAANVSTSTPGADEADGARTARGVLLLVSAILLFGLMDSLAKHLSQTYHVFQVVWARYVFHIAFLLPLLLRDDPLQLFRTERLGLQLFRSFMLLNSTCLFFLAISLMPLAEAAAITAVSPLFVTALSVPILGEKVGLRRWTAVCIGFAGVMIIIRPGPNVVNPWAFLPVLNALSFAFYTLTTRSLSRTEAPMTTLFYSAITGALVISAVVPFFWLTPDLWGWIMLATVGLIGGFSHLLLIRAYDCATASVLAPYSYTQLVWMAFLGYLFFGNLPDGWTIVGAVVVVGSGLYVFYREALRTREPGGA
jgi:drug/metabolite transporter (DMT)-like permease